MDTVYEALGKVRPREVREMLEVALKGDIIGAREKLRVLMYQYGLSGVDVIKLLHREVLSSRSPLRLNGLPLADLLVLIGDANYKIVEGADDEIQLMAVISKIALMASEAKKSE